MNSILQNLSLRLTCLGILLFTGFAVLGAEVKRAVNWEQFLSRHDLVWESLPDEWHEGAFLGNGRHGAMIYAEGTNVLQWDVGRSDVVDRGGRIAIGRFVLVRDAARTNGSMRLDLWNAEARGVFLTGNAESSRSELEWRSCTHTAKPVTVIELKGESAKLTFQHLPALPAREEYLGTNVPPEQRNPEPSFGASGEVQSDF
jgi:hypothetical protein